VRTQITPCEYSVPMYVNACRLRLLCGLPGRAAHMSVRSSRRHSRSPSEPGTNKHAKPNKPRRRCGRASPVPAQSWQGATRGAARRALCRLRCRRIWCTPDCGPWAADGTKRFPQLALSARRFWRTAQERAAKCRCGPVPCAPPSERAARCRSGRRTLARRRRVPSRAQCPAPGGQCRYCDYRYPGGPCCVVQTRCRVSIYCALGRWTA
jgi:hypothetical protein